MLRREREGGRATPTTPGGKGACCLVSSHTNLRRSDTTLSHPAKTFKTGWMVGPGVVVVVGWGACVWGGWELGWCSSRDESKKSGDVEKTVLEYWLRIELGLEIYPSKEEPGNRYPMRFFQT